MPRITRQEQKRLLGPLYRAEKKTTARNLHRLRKSLECFTEAELEECFPEGLVNLQVVMRPTGLHKIGTIRQTFIVDNKAVSPTVILCLAGS
ncbi:hypothetical protein C8F01DRAFT_1263511 [Mycena amicta]|nr:hypothetical protein C8F01DRAFT_1263511 [Mycena amicta]